MEEKAVYTTYAQRAGGIYQRYEPLRKALTAHLEAKYVYFVPSPWGDVPTLWYKSLNDCVDVPWKSKVSLL